METRKYSIGFDCVGTSADELLSGVTLEAPRPRGLPDGTHGLGVTAGTGMPYSPEEGRRTPRRTHMSTMPFARTGGLANESWARRAYADIAHVEGLPEAVAFRASGMLSASGWTAELPDGRLVDIRFPEDNLANFHYEIR